MDDFLVCGGDEGAGVAMVRGEAVWEVYLIEPEYTRMTPRSLTDCDGLCYTKPVTMLGDATSRWCRPGVLCCTRPAPARLLFVSLDS
jgi:hypothetical protein